MKGYRLGANGIIITFFAIITAVVLLPMVLFNPKQTPTANAYSNTAFSALADPTRGRQILLFAKVAFIAIRNLRVCKTEAMDRSSRQVIIRLKHHTSLARLVQVLI